MNGTGELGGERERAELALVLASPLFNRAPALSRILTFICEKRFRGEAESIKEYSIAIEALGRSQDFDSNSDTIVRVEASRLRRRLRQYYETEGARHQFQIFLPESGYIPQFVSLPERNAEEQIVPVVPEPAPAVEPAPPNTAWWSRSRVRLGAGLILAVGVTLALLYFRGVFRPSPTSGPAKPPPRSPPWPSSPRWTPRSGSGPGFRVQSSSTAWAGPGSATVSTRAATPPRALSAAFIGLARRILPYGADRRLPVRHPAQAGRLRIAPALR